MELQHWSHKHPLTLSEVKNHDGVEIVCNGCLQNITSGSSAYRCTNCLFFLHKLCAKLPRQIKHPTSPEKTLTLHLDPRDALPTLGLNDQIAYAQLSVYFCHNLCHHDFGGFNYFFGPIGIDIRCAARLINVEHEFHLHPLRPILTPALFECHACCTQHDKGLSYMCSTCYFWIHEDCALLPTTKYRGHVHPLTLCYYSLPDASCRICQEGFMTYKWSYQCRGCQYHAHANCATKTKESETVTEVEELDMTNLFRLPMPDESVNLFNQFVEQLNVPTVNLIDQFVEQLDLEHASNKIEAKLYNYIHSHPLILFDVDSEDNLCSMSKLSIHNDEQKNEKICDACVQPISVPFYSCSHSQCDFFMHKRCVELPIEIQHPCHPHLLSLDNRSSYCRWFTCRGCGKQCNGFTFQCTTDECSFNETFCLDVKCASLPSYIVHEFHEHPLRLRPNCTIEGCVACDRCNSTFSYGCGICNFHLHSNCALLPRTIKHKYDEHPFTLIYALIKDGPDEYICEFCEEDINPKGWFYHCIDCDQSACAKCIYKEEKEYSNIKLGITKKFNSHPHPLDLVQVVNKSFICDKCEQKIFGGENELAYMCVQCDTKLHVDCNLLRDMLCNTEVTEVINSA